jgi:hypothetical protein
MRGCPGLRSAQVDLDTWPIPLDPPQPCWRDHDLAPAQPLARVDAQQMDCPVPVVDQEVLDMPDLTVIGSDVVALDSRALRR